MKRSVAVSVSCICWELSQLMSQSEWWSVRSQLPQIRPFLHDSEKHLLNQSPSSCMRITWCRLKSASTWSAAKNPAGLSGFPGDSPIGRGIASNFPALKQLRKGPPKQNCYALRKPSGLVLKYFAEPACLPLSCLAACFVRNVWWCTVKCPWSGWKGLHLQFQAQSVYCRVKVDGFKQLPLFNHV